MRLRRIGDEKRLLLRQLVHPRAGGKVVGRLGAAVQHHDERQRLSGVAARNVELVGPASGLIGIGALFERRSRPAAERERALTLGPTKPSSSPAEPSCPIRSRNPRSASGICGWAHAAEDHLEDCASLSCGRHPGIPGLQSSAAPCREWSACARRALLSIALEIGAATQTTRWRGCSAQNRHRLLRAALSRVRRMRFCHVDLRKCVHRSDPCCWTFGKAGALPFLAEGIERGFSRCFGTEMRVSGCGRAAPPSRLDWLARLRAREWRRWSRAPVLAKRPLQ